MEATRLFVLYTCISGLFIIVICSALRLFDHEFVQSEFPLNSDKL
ncbi:unnamed protein product [Schistosoma margrebowiei]|uniref:Uncharacterized protein n=1 Tax=Schistosoma margrebowiei TaxID=48269 RepID=A0A3P8DK18_9TREM|nr:unnamed protein product [Schistosoma margrebowiei]